MFESHSILTWLTAQNHSFTVKITLGHDTSSIALSLITSKCSSKRLWYLKVRQFWFQVVLYSGIWHRTIQKKSTHSLEECKTSTLTLKMKAPNSFKTSVNFYCVTRHYIQKYNILHSCCCGNCKSNTLGYILLW